MKYTISLSLIIFSQMCWSQQFAEMTHLTNFAQPGRNHGVAVGDFNKDGLDDIYISRRESTNKLFVNRGDFIFEELSGDFGVSYEGDTNMSLWFDYDNDGDLDLYLGNKFEPNVLYRNDGHIFTDVSANSGTDLSGNLRSLNAADVDNDGDLDIYIAFAARQNALLINNGSGQFQEELTERGIDDTGSSMGAIFFDLDHDGDLDLYQTRDGNQGNLLYLNNGQGFFEDISDSANADLKALGMGVDVGYINDDDFPDLYVTNLYENFLMYSNENGRFSELAGQRNLADRGMGWGTMICDFNNDGLNDIYVANETSFPVQGQKLPNKLFLQGPGNSFWSDTKSEGIQNMYSSYGSAYGDFDNDGDLDLVIANQGNEGNQIFRNIEDAMGHFLKISLNGKQSNSHGIGSRIELYHAEGKMTDILSCGAGYASQNSSVLHFGLGEIERVDSIVIYWPSGIRQRIERPQIDMLHEIREEKSLNLSGPLVWTEPAFPTQSDDITVYFNAAEGNAELEGFGGQVFAHTGLITNQSTSPSDWRNVIGNWGSFDSRTLMNSEGNDIYSLSYNIEDFYDIQPGTVAEKLAFVFRNVDGSLVGRDSDGSDIFLNLYEDANSLLVNLVSPRSGQSNLFVQGESIQIELEVNREANIELYNNSELFLDTTATSLNYSYFPEVAGSNQMRISVSDSTDTQNFFFSYTVVADNTEREDPPAGTEPGVNYVTSSSYVFQLFAPGKNNVFLLCPANNFQLDGSFQMKRSLDGDNFWIELPRSLFANGKNVYQFLVDNQIVIADPFSEVVLDPNHDQWVADEVISELPDYPNSASGIVSVFDLEEEEYDWEVDSFSAPKKDDLVIYELLIRDFLSDRRYTSLTDTLDYLERLGINAIELMPIQEFEANDSWGYNPSFHMAVDKYYGSRDELKRFIDEAHKRGMAVILDVVFNHCFSQSPLAQLYWNAGAFSPSEESPYLNVTARHPFNVGYDFNHESPATNYWVKRVLRHWIEEFKFDGFRFDLSKGLTQTNSGNDAGFMSQYDASRISILKDYADYIWSLDPDNYVILEHFADNSEEIELANYGMMLWGNMNHQFNEAVMGFKSSLDWTDYRVRGWQEPHVVAYMESHDEERLMYRSLNFGEREGNYSTRELNTALDRVAAAHCLFMCIPGPKMMWQFGEMGFDYSINRCSDGSISNDCRLTPKPVRWDYLDDYYRSRLFDVVSSMIHLKTSYPSFSTRDYTFNDANFYLKTVHLNHPEMDVVCLVNFRVTDTEINPKFQYPGTWYEYFSGDTLEVSNVNEKLPFKPGEYRLYTSKAISPEGGILSHTKELVELDVELFPNPAQRGGDLQIILDEASEIEQIELLSITGAYHSMDFERSASVLRIKIPGHLTPGVYLIRIAGEQSFSIHELILH